MHPDFFSFRPWALVACATLLVAGPAVLGAPAAAPASGTSWPVPVGQTLPDVVMSGLNGPPRSLSSYRGRPMIINVWASWCGPCRAEAASLERLAWSKAGGRYAIIGVSIDDVRAEAMRWLGHSNATISHYIDARLTLEHLLGASTIPTTVLVDAQGRVVARFRGARDWDSAESVRLIEQSFVVNHHPG
jgi:thiol-disulfide isomerase/thioredoxin